MRFIGVLVIGVMAVFPAAAQLQPAPSPDVVGVNDLLCIGIWDTKPTGAETLKTVRVDAQGNVSLFHIGQLKLAGLNFEQAEAAINVAYRNNGILENASASLNRLEAGTVASIKSGAIAAGDRISVRILDLVPEVEHDRLLTVTAGGKVGLPLLGQTQVAGMTEAAAEQAIKQTLIDRFGVRNAVISVLRLGPKQTEEPTVAAPSSSAKTEADQPRVKK